MSLLKLAQRGDAAGLRAMLTAGAVDPNEADASGLTALHHAVYFDENECVEVLLAAGARVDGVTRRGCSAIHVACVSGAPRALALLLQHPAVAAVLDHRNEWGESALHLAAGSCHAFAVRALLLAGASAALLDRWGRAPVDVCVQHGGHADTLAAFSEHSIVAPSSHISSRKELQTTAHQVHPMQGQIVAEFMRRLETFKPRSENVVSKGIFASMPSHMDAGASAYHREAAETPPLSAEAECALISPPVQHARITASFENEPKKSLSKLVEYPGDPSVVDALLRDPSVEATGKVK